jgi:hypothetical protein
MQLIKALPKISARILHNTRCAPPNLKFKFELIAEAYGKAAVLADYEAWCHEHVSDNFPWPITEYMKVIDSRLGSAPEETKTDMDNPQIAELTSLSYELTGVLPAKRAVAELLMTYPFDEIKEALSEYTDNLSERETKGSMRAFYSDGGAGAIILARRRRSALGIIQK